MAKQIAIKVISYAGLASIFVASLLVFYQQIDLPMFKQIALVGTLAWFATAPFWINKNA